MTVKRRNHGRKRKNKGRVGYSITCDGCGGKCPKDKAIKRFQVRNIVDNSSLRDIRDASAYEEYTVPKMYMKVQYCVGCAVHRRIVRVRSREARRLRAPPRMPRRQFSR